MSAVNVSTKEVPGEKKDLKMKEVVRERIGTAKTTPIYSYEIRDQHKSL